MSGCGCQGVGAVTALLTLCAYSMCLPYVLTLCAYPMCLLYVLTLCAYPMCLLCVLTLCAYSVCLPYVLTLCAYPMCLLCVLTLCAYLQGEHDAVEQKSKFDAQLLKSNTDAAEFKAQFDKVTFPPADLLFRCSTGQIQVPLLSWSDPGSAAQPVISSLHIPCICTHV